MTQPTRAAVQDALRQAQMSFNQGNYSAAEPIYKQMVESIPPESEEYALCLHNLGEINEQRGNLTTAIWWQLRLLSHNLMTHEGMAHHLFFRMGHIAALYTKAGRPSEASALYQQMNDMRPKLAQQLPPGFEPQSEVGNFLKGLFDSVHKKYSADPAESEQTRVALLQLEQTGQTASATPSAPSFAPAPQAPSHADSHGQQQNIAANPQMYTSQAGQQAAAQQPFRGQTSGGQPQPNYAPQQALAVEAQPAQFWSPQAGAGETADDGGYSAPQMSAPMPQAQPSNADAELGEDWDDEEDKQAWTQKNEPGAAESKTDNTQTFESRAQMRQSAKAAARAEQAADEPQANYQSNELENIPAPSRMRPKPTEAQPARARQQDISPSYLKKEDESKIYINGQPRGTAPSGKSNLSQPEWEPPRRGKAPKVPKPKKFKRDSITTEDDFAPKRRVGMTEADTLDAAPTELNSNLQGLASSWTQLTNSKNGPIIIFGVILIVTIVVFQLPYPGKPMTQFKGMAKRYRTVDGTKQFALNTLTESQLQVGSEIQPPTPYKFYFGDWREAIYLAFGQLPEKQYWLTDKKTALVDENGVTFYDSGGGEKKLYDAMEAISRAVSQYYTLHDKKYPSSGEDIGAAELTYENPYTKQNSVANIQAAQFGDSSSKRGDIARGDLYDKLARGLSWDNEKALTPGAINCLSAQITTSRGLITAFFIQAADENSKPIMGSNANQSCYLALEDGKPLYSKSEVLPFVKDGTMRKRLIVILEKPIDSNLSYIVHNFACWLFSFLAFIAGGVFLALPKRSGSKAIAIAVIVIFGAIGTLYLIANRL